MQFAAAIWKWILSRTRRDVIASAVLHVVLLGATMVWFTNATPLKVEDSVPVDVISDTEFSKSMAGLKTAPKSETPKPMADKVGEAKPATDAVGKIVDNKQEVRTASKEATPPPEPKVKPAEVKKTEAKTDEIAEALKKAEKKPAPPKQAQPKKPDPNLDSKIESKLALLDKRDAQRQTVTNSMVSPASLGMRTPNSNMNSQTWAAAFKSKVEGCWAVPAGTVDVAGLVVDVRVRLNRDGTLAAEPVVTNHSSSPTFRVAAEAAVRAVQRCGPYTFLPISQYDSWQDFEAEFNPAEMYGSTRAAATRF
jgi:colicin import membrane protein